jgi:hypothetical protein
VFSRDADTTPARDDEAEFPPAVTFQNGQTNFTLLVQAKQKKKLFTRAHSVAREDLTSFTV